MKKILALVVSLSLLCCLLFSAGCGSDVAKAQEDMKKGDDLVSDLGGYMDDKAKSLTDLLTAFGLDILTISAGEWDKKASEINKELDKMISNANKAQEEYEKILELSDVDEYQEYAELMIKTIENLIPVLEGLQDLLDVVGKAVGQGKSAKDAANNWLDENRDVQVRLAKSAVYWAEALAYKSLKNLGQTEEDKKVEEEKPAEDSAPE